MAVPNPGATVSLSDVKFELNGTSVRVFGCIYSDVALGDNESALNLTTHFGLFNSEGRLRYVDGANASFSKTVFGNHASSPTWRIPVSVDIPIRKTASMTADVIALMVADIEFAPCTNKFHNGIIICELTRSAQTLGFINDASCAGGLCSPPAATFASDACLADYPQGAGASAVSQARDMQAHPLEPNGLNIGVSGRWNHRVYGCVASNVALPNVASMNVVAFLKRYPNDGNPDERYLSVMGQGLPNMGVTYRNTTLSRALPPTILLLRSDQKTSVLTSPNFEGRAHTRVRIGGADEFGAVPLGHDMNP